MQAGLVSLEAFWLLDGVRLSPNLSSDKPRSDGLRAHLVTSFYLDYLFEDLVLTSGHILRC